MDVDQAALSELVNGEVECQVAGYLQDTIATAVQEMFMDAIQLPPESVGSLKQWTFNGLINVFISRIM